MLACQGERVQFTVAVDKPVPGLQVEPPRLVRPPGRAQHGRQVDQRAHSRCRAGDRPPGIGPDLPGQFLGAVRSPTARRSLIRLAAARSVYM